MIGITISEEEYKEYMALKKKDTPMKKDKFYGIRRCPVCRYIVDYAVPPQYYCDRCGQKLK